MVATGEKSRQITRLPIERNLFVLKQHKAGE